jgi:hypothetical protein
MASRKESTLGTWILIVGLFLYFLAYSAFAYFAIGDKGPPDWDFGTVQDGPGQSPYAIREPYHPVPYSQHVRGKQGTEEYPSDILRFSGED